MKILILLAAASLCLSAQSASAKPSKTKSWDALGTTFVVLVDWDTNSVSANLQANPARLSGDELEQSMQWAVYYSSAVGCRMRETGRKQAGKNVTVGHLHCPWFETESGT
jgi:hypothetical protein